LWCSQRIGFSLPNLCCSQWIRWSLLNFDVCSESVACCQICVVRSESCIRRQIMLSSTKWIRCSLLNLCCLLRIGFLLLNLCCSQRIRWSMPNYVVRSESGLMPKFCCWQRICVRCRSCVVYSGSVIHSRNRVACNKLEFAAKNVLVVAKVAFATEIVVPTSKQFSLLNYVAGSEPVFALELYGWKRTSFRSWTVRPASNQFSQPNCVASSESVSLPIFYNRPPRHKWLKCL